MLKGEQELMGLKTYEKEVAQNEHVKAETKPTKILEPVWSPILNTGVQCSTMNTGVQKKKNKHVFGRVSVFSVV